MDATGHAQSACGHQVPLLSLPLPLCGIQHPPQTKGALLPHKLLYTLYYHAWVDCAGILSADRVGRTHGGRDNGIALVKYNTTDAVRFTSAYVGGASSCRVLRYHHAKRVYFVGVHVCCHVSVSPPCNPPTCVHQSRAMRVGRNDPAHAQAVGQNPRDSKKR